MKAYIVMKHWGDRDCRGTDYLGVCLTEEAADKYAEQQGGVVEEVDVLDVGFLPQKGSES